MLLKPLGLGLVLELLYKPLGFGLGVLEFLDKPLPFGIPQWGVKPLGGKGSTLRITSMGG